MLHKNILAADMHILHSFTVADEAARLALVPTATDVGKLVWQQDNNTFWIIIDESPLTFVSVSDTIGWRLFRFRTELGSTTDADPTAGLFKWNNGTQSAATAIYLSDDTYDGVDMSALHDALPKYGFLIIQDELTPSIWQMWRWGAAPIDGTDYFKFTSLTLMAKSAADFADNRFVFMSFIPLPDELPPTQSIIIACGDETTAASTGLAKVTFRMPYAFTLTDARAHATVAPTGSAAIIDVNDDTGNSIFGTDKISIDAGEKTSVTAATAVDLSVTSFADDEEMTIDFDQVGSSIPGAGYKVTLIGYKTP
jgi:hypothetical protein